ncbi:MAG TPA: HIT domain-containing protein [bacterium]|nr:HIT domain-containing protein [bacterium]
MKDLWAPWRKEFILGPKIEGCIFCKLPKQKKDRDNLILFRGKHHFIILNRFPYNNGHLMVVPYRHTKDMSRLKDPENAEMLRLSALSIKALEKTMFPQGHNLGINLGAAGGAGIRDHLHLHVVPRWTGDTNWMPVLDETKVMIEYLWETYDRLKPMLEKLAKKRRSS